MVFVLNKDNNGIRFMRDAVRNRNLWQQMNDMVGKKKMGSQAPQELPNIALCGLTSNGTHFFCSLVHKKDLLERKKNNILTFVDAYANAKTDAERVQLKNKIKEACGEQIEGIALLFSDKKKTYGFVTGSRVKAASANGGPVQYGGPVQLNSEEMFTDFKNNCLSRFYFFILDHETENVSELITEYLQSHESHSNTINTEVFNAIKYATFFSSDKEYYIDSYLKAAYAVIQDSTLRQQAETVYKSLQLLGREHKEIRYKATVLTIQLLHSENNQHRIQLLTEYNQLASALYDSKAPAFMIVGIAMLTLGVGLFALGFVCPLMSIPLGAAIAVNQMGLLLAASSPFIINEETFFMKEAKMRRNTANTLFSLKKEFDKAPEEQIIPSKIYKDTL